MQKRDGGRRWLIPFTEQRNCSAALRGNFGTTLMMTFFRLLFVAFVFRAIDAVEQRLIIDLDKGGQSGDGRFPEQPETEDNFLYAGRRYGGLDGAAGSRNNFNIYSERPAGFGITGFRATASRGGSPDGRGPTRTTPSPQFPTDVLPNSVYERVDRLEANQNSFRRSVMAEWQALGAASNADKRIRLFTNAAHTWPEAQRVCEANAGQLLRIESADENRQITELLRNASASAIVDDDAEASASYWIGMQSTIAFSIPADRYSNFDVIGSTASVSDPSSVTNSSAASNSPNSKEARDELATAEQADDDVSTAPEDRFRRGCATISPTHGGKWRSRDCAERHQFICQI